MSVHRFVTRPGFFRLLLASAVVVSHLSNLEIGRPAVMIFFILSGYWVTRMFDTKYAIASHRIRTFYASRLLRIWPVYACVLVLAVITFATLNISSQSLSLSNLTLIGLASTEGDPLGVSWSLDIELQFYLLLPVFLGLVAWSEQHRFGTLKLAGLAIAAFLWGWFLQLEFGIWTVLSYLPLFAAGMILARLEYLPTTRTALLSGLAFLAVGVLATLLPFTEDYLLKDAVTPFPEDWFGMFWALTLLPFIAWNVQQESPQLDRHLGNISYTLYLVHWPVILISQSFLPAQMGHMWKVIAILVSFTLATLIYALCDMPLERLRRQIIRRLQVKPAERALA
ncbi:MAG: acyltransferase [Aquisalinus sp.]|nr:acyltransferase [Aquisalinus sp.]